MNSRTDMNYVNAGVISPDEVRGALKEDENSGYNTLSEEMEGEPVENDPFADLLGGSENSQNPFKSASRSEVDGNGEFSATQLNDGDVRVCETNSTGATGDEWKEGDPRRANGQFGEGGSGKVEKSSRSDKIRKRTRKEVQLPKDEYARVMSEIRTNITSEEKQKAVFKKYIGNARYTIQNLEDDYRIIGKKEIQ